MLEYTKGEYPNRNPPNQAAGLQLVNRLHAIQQPHALNAGASVSARVVEAIGPQAQVNGARTRPISGVLALTKRFVPFGAHTSELKNGLSPWDRAYAGQAVNQICWPASLHAHVAVVVRWPSHACQKRATAGKANTPMTPRCRKIARMVPRLRA